MELKRERMAWKDQKNYNPPSNHHPPPSVAGNRRKLAGKLQRPTRHVARQMEDRICSVSTSLRRKNEDLNGMERIWRDGN